jgi:diketogulonate reductase-like aldo/keto reductase
MNNSGSKSPKSSTPTKPTPTTTTTTATTTTTTEHKRAKKSPKSFATLYGTAWKADKTSQLVNQAISLGFRGIDTAGQPKHYNEKGVGEGITAAMKANNLSREDLFIQTKFSSIDAQNFADIKHPDSKPYCHSDPLDIQVRKSVTNSLHNLNIDYIDSLVLHGPLRTYDETLQVWRAMEREVDEERVDNLGISNCYSLKYLQRLHSDAIHKPQVVQNRFYEESGWDINLRQWCRQQGITYQSFWTLTANPQIIHSAPFVKIAQKKQIVPESMFHMYLIQRGCQPLNGSKTPNHITQDLEFVKYAHDPNDNEYKLTKQELGIIGGLMGDTTDL